MCVDPPPPRPPSPTSLKCGLSCILSLGGGRCSVSFPGGNAHGAFQLSPGSGHMPHGLLVLLKIALGRWHLTRCHAPSYWEAPELEPSSAPKAATGWERGGSLLGESVPGAAVALQMLRWAGGSSFHTGRSCQASQRPVSAVKRSCPRCKHGIAARRIDRCHVPADPLPTPAGHTPVTGFHPSAGLAPSVALMPPPPRPGPGRRQRVSRAGRAAGGGAAAGGRRAPPR